MRIDNSDHAILASSQQRGQHVIISDTVNSDDSVYSMIYLLQIVNKNSKWRYHYFIEY